MSLEQIQALYESVERKYGTAHAQRIAATVTRDVDANPNRDALAEYAAHARALDSVAADFPDLFAAPTASRAAVTSTSTVRGGTVTRTSLVGAGTVTVDEYGPNPLLEELAQDRPLLLPYAKNIGDPVPTMFLAGDLPPITTSDLTATQLMAMPWWARIPAALAEPRVAAQIAAEFTPGNRDPKAVALDAQMKFGQRALSNKLIAKAVGAEPADGIADYIFRVKAWASSYRRASWYPAEQGYQQKFVNGNPVGRGGQVIPTTYSYGPPKNPEPGSPAHAARVKAKNDYAEQVFRARHPAPKKER